MIVDSDTGARKKVKDFPALRDFARHSERQLEQTRRAHAEIKHEKSEKTKSLFTFMVVTIALLGIGGAGAWYVLTRKAADKTQLAERSEEAEIDAFLKDVKLSFQRANVAKRGSGGGHRTRRRQHRGRRRLQQRRQLRRRQQTRLRGRRNPRRRRDRRDDDEALPRPGPLPDAGAASGTPACRR